MSVYHSPGVRTEVADALAALLPGDRFRVVVAVGRWAEADLKTYVGTYLGPVAAHNGNVSGATFAMTGVRGPDNEPVVAIHPAYLVRSVEVLETGRTLAAEYLGLTPAGARMELQRDAKRALGVRARTEAAR